jgi:PAS domain S-box-containing protein
MTMDDATVDQPFKRLFNRLGDPVVEFELTDGEPIIVETNRAFGEVFAPDIESVAGRRLNELIVPSDRRDEAAAFDRRTESGESNAAVVERLTADGRRRFVYRGVPCGEDRGFAIYSDVTEKLRRERHLNVLQRVLRHNLRNDLNIVLGLAEKIGHTAETEEVKRAADSIRETAQKLSRLSEETKIVQRVLGESTTLESIQLSGVIENVAADCRQRFDDGTITVDCPPDIEACADENLQIVVDTLVDNAIRHNTASKPTVTIRATIEDDRVELSVVDNGPGIPATERRVITGDEDITPLTHGSGLGLWLVRWTVEDYGGDLAIETPASGGTIVRIYLDCPTTAP